MWNFFFSLIFPPPYKKNKKKNGLTTVKIFSQQLLSLLHLRLNSRKKRKKKLASCTSAFFFLFCFLRSEQASVTRARDGGERTHGNIAGAEREIWVFFFPLSAGPGDFTASCSHVAVTGCQ